MKKLLWVGLLTFSLSLKISSQSFNNPNDSSFISSIMDKVKICQWKYNAPTAFAFTFDDNNPSDALTARVLSEHGLKGTFFVIGNFFNSDSIRYIDSLGHEIRSHSLSHPDLLTLKEDELIYQLSKSKEKIESALGKPIFSFTEPYHRFNEFTRQIAQKQYLFCRDYTPKSRKTRTIIDVVNTFNKDELTQAVQKAQQNHKALMFSAHGLNGEGYQPLTFDQMHQFADSVQKMYYSGEIWPATVWEIGCYETLYNDLDLQIENKADTLILKFDIANFPQFDILPKIPISFIVPVIENYTINPLNELADMIRMEDHWIITANLKNQSVYKFTWKQRLQSNPLSTPVVPEKTLIYPNPATNEVTFNVPDFLKAEFYSAENKKLFSTFQNECPVNILIPGIYMVKIFTINGDQTLSSKTVKLIKK